MPNTWGFIDDASTDDTTSLVEGWLYDHPDNCVTFIRNSERQGMLANNLAGFSSAHPSAIGIELNGDDWLPDPGVLRFFNKIYQDPEVWMTYNTLRQTDGTILFQLPPPRGVRRLRGYRQAPWMTSHLRTFRVGLYHHLPDRRRYFRRLEAALRPGGRIAIIELEDLLDQEGMLPDYL